MKQIIYCAHHRFTVSYAEMAFILYRWLQSYTCKLVYNDSSELDDNTGSPVDRDDNSTDYYLRMEYFAKYNLYHLWGWIWISLDLPCEPSV